MKDQETDTGNWENVFSRLQSRTATIDNRLNMKTTDFQIHKDRMGNTVLLKIGDYVLNCELAGPEDVQEFDDSVSGPDWTKIPTEF